jgi:hypothetical protein
LRTLAAAAAIAAFGGTIDALADEVSISAFFGEYVGHSITLGVTP